MKIFKLPDLGEGLPDAEIVEWHVKPGDKVEVDQLLVSMETAKAVVDVPSPYTGEIARLCGQPGDVILTGAPLVEFASAVGREDTGTVAGDLESSEAVIEHTPQIAMTAKPDGNNNIKVTPAVRALAKQLGVNLAQVTPTGYGGSISLQDVKAAANAPTSQSKTGFDESLRGVRRQMAIAMVKSHEAVVPVTVLDEADVTNWIATEDITVKLIQAIVFAAQQEPALNAWFDGETLSRKVHTQIHLGLAMDTADGLFVPVIQDAQEKTGATLRQMINTLKTQVTSRAVSPEALQGATITLSNFGKFAGLYANPIIVPPQVAILAVGRIYQTPRIAGEQMIARYVAPLSLTFDHRAVTGGEATRFLGALIKFLSG